MSITMIWAMDEQRLIGKDNGMPWHLPNDMKFFRENTKGKTVVMGRKTYESLNGALPKRRNLVLTRNSEWRTDDAEVITDINPVLELAQNEEVMIIGGAQIYNLFMPHADKLLVTRISGTFEGDERFPVYDEHVWELEWEQPGIVDEKNAYSHQFQSYLRKNRSKN
ncbi:dihydrofolate reductase [Paenibacillus alvei]|uniref:dihydrofolate reductase n=1 Tax=Paenibacillus alvei TaxID=44250 RepID=UPI000289BFA4|nr:dihydrofolate reductase [Paenibacillus alvei]EJW15714.1 dihydrofolate reductase DfrA [Paenibacillus alvei DSM 29]MCY9543587.1 dihydrofolate reductase [Paenibacillus alvei]MCY9707464.1 dihydrofolate reductase [Paenibacillus alvei]MCY9734134.1 dihydrofolate reductase [Paenibacillus alvei]MCY9756311.1 dihydrofolate reductase [Paenibacillus alvei]